MASTDKFKAAATGRADLGEAKDETIGQKMTRLKEQIETLTNDQLTPILGAVSPIRFASAAWTAVLGNPDLISADRQSLMMSLRRAAADNMVPDGFESVLNIYNVNIAKRGGPEQWIQRVQYLIMVGGIVKKLYESGEVLSVDAACVYEKDKFRFVRGDAPRIEHEPYDGDGDPGAIRAAYAVIKLRNGELKREVMFWRDIVRVRAVSKSWGNNSSPWQKWPDQQSIKSVLHRIYKQIPHTPALDRLIANDIENMIESTAREVSAPLQAVSHPAIGNEPADVIPQATIPREEFVGSVDPDDLSAQMRAADAELARQDAEREGATR